VHLLAQHRLSRQRHHILSRQGRQCIRQTPVAIVESAWHITEKKIAVYQAVVLTTLLYGCMTWTLYCRSIQRLDQFHLCCLRKIAHVKWQDRIPNTDVLNVCDIMGIEAFLLKAQLRWVGHIMRMPDSWIPKQVFLGQLAVGKHLQCGPVLRYKDTLKVNVKQCSIDPSTLSSDTRLFSLEISVLWSSQPVWRLVSRSFWTQKSSLERGSTLQQPQHVAVWQLLPHLQLQNWTPCLSTNTSVISDSSFFDGAVHGCLFV